MLRTSISLPSPPNSCASEAGGLPASAQKERAALRRGRLFDVVDSPDEDTVYPFHSEVSRVRKE